MKQVWAHNLLHKEDLHDYSITKLTWSQQITRKRRSLVNGIDHPMIYQVDQMIHESKRSRDNRLVIFEFPAHMCEFQAAEP